jgi:hypothetical protein
MLSIDDILAGVQRIKAKAVDADVLVSELEKVRDKLPKEANDALDKHIKKKTGKK